MPVLTEVNKHQLPFTPPRLAPTIGPSVTWVVMTATHRTDTGD
jgi:hypothetical protein